MEHLIADLVRVTMDERMRETRAHRQAAILNRARQRVARAERRSPPLLRRLARGVLPSTAWKPTD